MAQTVVIQAFMSYGLGITIKGDPLLVLLINIILAAGSLSLGTLLSAFAKNEFQLFQFIPIVIVPQVLFSGLLSLRNAPVWVVALSKIFPLTYGADALTDVALRGAGFGDVWFDILVITAYAVLFILLNSLALKKYRRL
jgi:ABC-2 type transport system permease protein